MGLDMYLTKRTYVKNWEFMKPEERHEVTVTKNGQPVTRIKTERIKEIIEDVGYWRKANAIHQWFVTNVQDGNDDCGDYYVSEKKLRELLDTVNRVLTSIELVPGEIVIGRKFENGKFVDQFEPGQTIKDFSLAQELLPTQSGFFFGGTDYDKYYVDDLKLTKTIIEQAVAEGGDGEYYYHSSW